MSKPVASPKAASSSATQAKPQTKHEAVQTHLETPQKLSPEKISTTASHAAVAEEARPLKDAVKPTVSPERESTLWRIYSVFLVALLVLIVGLVLARRLGLLSSSNEASGLATASSTKSAFGFGAGFGSWLTAVTSIRPQVFSDPSESISERDFYRPQITHRQKLGAGRELVTLHMAGQWLLLGITPTQIQFIANLTREAAETEPSKLDDAQLAGLYEKYVDPIAAEGRRVSRRQNGYDQYDIDVEDASQLAEAFRRELTARETQRPSHRNGRSIEAPNEVSNATRAEETSPEIHYDPALRLSQPQLGEASSQNFEEDFEEIELPDFEDVFDPAQTILRRPSTPPASKNGLHQAVGAYGGAWGGHLKDSARTLSPTTLQPRTSAVENTLQTMAESPGPLPAHPSQPSPDYLV